MDPRKLYWYFVNIIRSKIRSQMRPMTIDEAQEKRELFAKLYCAMGFLTLTYIVFKIGKEKTNFDYGSSSPSPIDVINKLNTKGDVRVFSFEGFRKVDEYTYNTDRPNEIRRTGRFAKENLDGLMEKSPIGKQSEEME